MFSVYLWKPLFISIVSPRVTPEPEFLFLTNEDLLSRRGNEHQTLGLVSGTQKCSRRAIRNIIIVTLITNNFH